MHVYVENPTLETGLLLDRMLTEGDELVQKKNDADLIVDGEKTEIPIITFDFFSIPILADPPKEEPDFILVRYFHVDKWCDQCLVGFPLTTLMNDDLGPTCITGLGGRYLNIKESEITIVFDDPEFLEYFKESGFDSFVTLGCHFMGDGAEFRLSSCTVGLPPFLACGAIIEGVRDRLSDYMAAPWEHRLFESWTASLLVSVFPWPLPDNERRILYGVTPGVRKHFLLPDGHGVDRSNYVMSNLVGLATAYGENISDADARARRTCGSIKVKDKQFRTDLSPSVKHRWMQLIGARGD